MEGQHVRVVLCVCEGFDLEGAQPPSLEFSSLLKYRDMSDSPLPPEEPAIDTLIPTIKDVYILLSYHLPSLSLGLFLPSALGRSPLGTPPGRLIDLQIQNVGTCI